MAKGLLAIGITHGTHVGIWAGNVPDYYLSLCMRKNRCCSCYGQYQLQAGRTGISLRESDIQILVAVNGEKDSNFVEMTHAMLPELKTFERGHMKSKRFHLHEKRHLHRAGKNTGNVQYIGNPAVGQQHRR